MSFEQHLNEPRGRGALADWPHAGAAGGAACGDLVRVAVRVEGDRIVEAGFDAEGCGAALAAGSAVVELVEGADFLDAARVGADEVAAALGGLIPAKRHAAELAADALHRALGAAARDGAPALAPSPTRTLVAMSGGVDSAAAAQLALDAGDEVVAVTLELWSDPGTDGTASCCSPQAVTGARALAHGMGLPHLTLDLRERFRAEVVDGFLAGYAAGRTPEPLRALQRRGALRRDARAGRERSAPRGWRPATTRASPRDDDGPLVRQAVDPLKDQSYMLARLEPALLERLAFPLGGADQARGARARPRRRPVGRRQAREPGPLLRRRPRRTRLPAPPRRRAARRRGRDRHARRHASLGRHDGHHDFTVGQRRGIGVAAPEPLYVLAKDARRNRVVVGPRERARRRTGSSSRHAACTVRRIAFGR